MKISDDLAVKLALGAAVIGAALWAASRARAAIASAGADLYAKAGDAAWAVTPWNNNNLAARAANGVVSAVTGREETLGGWLYSATHADPFASPVVPPEYTGPTGFNAYGDGA
ncbi:MAG: hypothetical protein ABIN37_06470 [Burkholderiaceae bacterium]